MIFLLLQILTPLLFHRNPQPYVIVNPFPHTHHSPHRYPYSYHKSTHLSDFSYFNYEASLASFLTFIDNLCNIFSYE